MQSSPLAILLLTTSLRHDPTSHIIHENVLEDNSRMSTPVTMEIPQSQEVHPTVSLFSTLPAEVRLSIFEYAFDNDIERTGFRNHYVPTGLILDDKHSSADSLGLLLTCRQFYEDASLIAMRKTPFVISNLFSHIPEQMAILHPKQQAAIRHLSFVADARHFRRFVEWKTHAFSMANLQLDTLTVVLHQSTPWHYLFDFTQDIVHLLRTLCNVKRLLFVRNGARVKGSFKTWYNRLVGLIMKVDHQERYERGQPNLESVWWRWHFDELGQRICLDAEPPKALVSEEEYLEEMLPHMESLRLSIESEEVNPDPRSESFLKSVKIKADTDQPNPRTTGRMMYY